MKPANLIIVAYPADETLRFSTLCPGASIVVVGDPKWQDSLPAVRSELQQAAGKLGARRVIYLHHLFDDVESPHFQGLIRKLKRLKGHRRVYTHSPFDDDSFRRIIALAAARAFGKVWVEGATGVLRQVNVLGRKAFQQKLQIINDVYALRQRSEDDEYRIPHTALLGVEAFTPVTFAEVMHSVALTSSVILPFPDAWGLLKSPYESERYDRSCELLAGQAAPGSIGTILEVGACEGAMTAHLRKSFPDASICAVEPHPVFAARLRARFRKDKNVQVVQASILDVPLEADVIVLAEVLYYVEADQKKTLARMRAKYLMTSCEGAFELDLCRLLSRLKWRTVASTSVASRFEPVNGARSSLFCRREGTNIRIWKHDRSKLNG